MVYNSGRSHDGRGRANLCDTQFDGASHGGRQFGRECLCGGFKRERCENHFTRGQRDNLGGANLLRGGPRGHEVNNDLLITGAEF